MTTSNSSPHPLALAPDALARHCDVGHFDFETTADLPSLRAIIGQPRGVRAIEFGIDMATPGYNIYVMGARGTGRLTAIERFIKARAADDPIPDDWLYAHNFDAPHQPYALRLPAGMGRQLTDTLQALIPRLRVEMARAFESQSFTEAAQAIKREFQHKREQIFTQVQAVATEKGFVIRTTQTGIMLTPLKDGEVLSAEAYEALEAAERAEMEKNRLELEDQLADSLREAADLEELAGETYAQLQRTTTAAILETQFAGLQATYADHEPVLSHLARVREHIMNNIDTFASEEAVTADDDGGPSEEGAPPPAGEAEAASPGPYTFNLLVDHSAAEGAPVVVVGLPTYQNLIGRIEHRVQYGALTTDFTMIKPGALHQANGGFLVLRAMDILRQPFAWEALKRALDAGEVRIEEPESRGTSVITTQTLEPEAIPLSVKVIMIGNPMLYYTLFEQEEDFPELFKVKADFAADMDRDTDSEAQYAAFVAARCHEDNLPPFTAAAAGRVVDYGAWLAADQERLSTRFGEIADLIHEAAYYARRAERDTTSKEDVSQAIDERRFRNNLYEELSQRRIVEGDVIIDTAGEVVGQINGLTVLQLGDYTFGQPSRITARTYLGQTGVVQIEREVQLTGPIHDKGLLILRGYLGSTYAQDFPLTLAASLTFEQNYGGVEGDSASSTELYALLSALSGYPVKQSLAVTGSVDQRGVIQPIGGVTHKIEGFFAICQQRGLDGTHGVLIPRQNVRNLMLNETVTRAVQEGQFHIYAIETTDQGIELLTGHPAGQRQPDGSYPPGTVHHTVQARLRALAEGLRSFTAPTIHFQQGEN